ncbi:MAG: serine/threonine protein kinase [Planctomycetes bacterium]|nr:serine/threonine protein kinase [Planctomycetota bacterium]
MTERRTCRRCGTSFEPTQSPHGMCPQCLLAAGMREPEEVAARKAVERAPAVEELVPLFPELDFEGLVGQGGMGFVFRARHRELGRTVALKLLAREHAVEPSFAERFRREARTLARLSHPGIVAIFDSGERGGWFYLLMEFVEGANLRHLMKSARVEPAQALSIVGQVCAALQYSHDQGVVHRDIKPENVLIDVAGHVKIADFGLARLVDRDLGAFALTGSHQVMGTPHYMAPEQWEKPQSVDHRADIYALGVVFYELLTGEMPLGRFDAPSKRVQVDVRLDEVVLKALEKQPERRYQQASEVQSDLDSIASSAGPVPNDEEPPTVASITWAVMEGFGLLMAFTAIALAKVADLHFHDQTPTRNAYWGAALGLGIGGALLAFTSHHTLGRRADFRRASRGRGFMWTDGALALFGAVGAIGLICALLSKPNHPATETVWLASALTLVYAVAAWILRQFTSRRGARVDVRPRASSASDSHVHSNGALFLFGFVHFIGVHFVISAAGVVVSALVPSNGARLRLTPDNVSALLWPIGLELLMGLPCMVAAWHVLRLSSRTASAWTSPTPTGFDGALGVFALASAGFAIALVQLPAWSDQWWIYATHCALGLALSLWFARRRWTSRTQRAVAA